MTNRKLIKFNKILEILADLSDWEKEFCNSIDNQLNRYGKSIDDLSEKQLAVIDRIWDKHHLEIPPDEELPPQFVPDKESRFIP